MSIASPGAGFAKFITQLEKVVIVVVCATEPHMEYAAPTPKLGLFQCLPVNSFLSISVITTCKWSARGMLSNWSLWL